MLQLKEKTKQKGNFLNPPPPVLVTFFSKSINDHHIDLYRYRFQVFFNSLFRSGTPVSYMYTGPQLTLYGMVLAIYISGYIMSKRFEKRMSQFAVEYVKCLSFLYFFTVTI
jgi:hypothetical protein